MCAVLNGVKCAVMSGKCAVITTAGIVVQNCTLLYLNPANFHQIKPFNTAQVDIYI